MSNRIKVRADPVTFKSFGAFMLKKLSTLLIFGAAAVAIGCGGTEPANSANANKASATNTTAPAAVNLDPGNMPPGLSANPMQQSANVPGVNSNTVQPKGGASTPGIPSPAELKKPFKPGTTPTPGIPSEAEIRRMLGKPAQNPNANVPMMKSNPPMMKSNKPLAGKPNP
jgi:hypothetical protein